jgi:hypothetical protein
MLSYALSWSKMSRQSTKRCDRSTLFSAISGAGGCCNCFAITPCNGSATCVTLRSLQTLCDRRVKAPRSLDNRKAIAPLLLCNRSTLQFALQTCVSLCDRCKRSAIAVLKLRDRLTIALQSLHFCLAIRSAIVCRFAIALPTLCDRRVNAPRSLDNRFPIASLLLCNRSTIALQSLCNRRFIALRSLCQRFAIALLTLCDRLANALRSLY